MEVTVNDQLFQIIKFKSKLSDTDIVIETCGDSFERLRGYYIVLDKNDWTMMELFLKSQFSKYTSLISAAFKNEKKVEITQLCKTFLPSSYTAEFIKRYGGIDNLLLDGPSGKLPPLEKAIEANVDVSTIGEEEDPEMIKELQDKLDAIQKEMEEKESKIATLIEENEKLKKFRDSFPDEVVSEEDIELFQDLMEEQGDKAVVDALAEIIIEKYDNKEEEKLSELVTSLIDKMLPDEE